MSQLADASFDQQGTVAMGETGCTMRTEIGEPAQVHIVAKVAAIEASIAERDGLAPIVEEAGARPVAAYQPQR